MALTHRSFCAENEGSESNERLEFLGDAVLGLAVTDYIHRTYPNLPEGQLAKLRASVVNTSALAAISRDLGLGTGLRLGKGEEMSGGCEKESILADGLEALIGAVFVDAGWPQACQFTLDLVLDIIHDGAARPGQGDFKTQLQELSAELDLGTPTYRIAGSGPDHDKRFTAIAVVAGQPYGQGDGTSKKRAEQDAARTAWLALTESANSNPTPDNRKADRHGTA